MYSNAYQEADIVLHTSPGGLVTMEEVESGVNTEDVGEVVGEGELQLSQTT